MSAVPGTTSDSVAGNQPPVVASTATARTATTTKPARPATYSPFVALLLCELALLGWLAFQTLQLTNDRQALQATNVALQQTVDSAAKLRTSLDALAADTQRVADAGNPSARVLIEELRKRGITINSPAAPAAPAAAPVAKPGG